MRAWPRREPAMVSLGRPKGATGEHGGAAARVVLALTAVGALIGLAACGSTAAGGAAHPASAGASGSADPSAAVTAPAGVSLCAASGRVDRVVAMPGGSH